MKLAGLDFVKKQRDRVLVRKCDQRRIEQACEQHASESNVVECMCDEIERGVSGRMDAIQSWDQKRDNVWNRRRRKINDREV